MTNTASAPNLELSFSQLPEIMYSKAQPGEVTQPQSLLLNTALASDLGIDETWLHSEDALQVLSGNHPLQGLAAGQGSIATAYTGHQFGQLNPRLGDGRAHLLGELISPAGARVDIQLKGSGVTPYSRQGDGRSPLGPVIREYLVSEAMAALGVPTSRSLAAMATGDNVWRQQGAEPGAVLTRIADSHIRVGSFQYAAMQGPEVVQALADYVSDRHFADMPASDMPYLDLLQAVIAKQANLIAQWMSIGFIHGVMNTDNMLVCGQTIDYGPCAFMDDYFPQQVFSFIDRQGRYRYDNQPGIGQWNLVRFAETLLPIMGEDKDQAVAEAQTALNDYQMQYEQAYAQLMAAKLGLTASHAELVTELLHILQAGDLDYTLSFRYLMALLVTDETIDKQQYGLPEAVYTPTDDLMAWQEKWLAVIATQGHKADSLALMAQNNPIFIPRNHLVDAAIKASYKGDLSLTNDLLTATGKPFAYDPQWQYLAIPPQAEQIIANTFCGT